MATWRGLLGGASWPRSNGCEACCSRASPARRQLAKLMALLSPRKRHLKVKWLCCRRLSSMSSLHGRAPGGIEAFVRPSTLLGGAHAVGGCAVWREKRANGDGRRGAPKSSRPAVARMAPVASSPTVPAAPLAGGCRARPASRAHRHRRPIRPHGDPSS